MRMQIKAKRARKGASQRGLAPSDSRLKGGSTPLQNPRTIAKTATASAMDDYVDPYPLETLIAIFGHNSEEVEWFLERNPQYSAR